jgi:hypothetical protein
MRLIMIDDRRRFLAAVAALGIGTLNLTSGQVRADDKPKDDKTDESEEEVGARQSDAPANTPITRS